MERQVIVVGGGLAGLAAGTYLARGGRRVTVLERSRFPGGRARTTDAAGFHLNLGPHALHAGGAGARILRELGVPFSGGVPPASGCVAIAGNALHQIPASFVSLLATDLLRFGSKVELARVLVSLTRADPEPLMGVTLSDWLDGQVQRPDVRAVIEAFVRLATYVHAPGRLSAGAAFRQLRSAFDASVYYLDGGWETLVHGLAAAARDAGVEIRCGTDVARVAHDGGEVFGVELRDGSLVPASSVVVAAPPEALRRLVGKAPFPRSPTPVRLACLDLGLAALPDARRIVAVGIDRPVYLAVHSEVARLAPEGGAVVHAARYLTPDEAPERDAVVGELEALVDLVQPGWRDEVVVRRFLPSMVVTHALVEASSGGRRPGAAIPGFRGLHAVGDWIGPEGMLVDAALASARSVAAELLHPNRTVRTAVASGALQ
jgi:phytoene dehydrogenase-like protein